MPRDIDRAWLEENLLGIRPEVVGAAWDLAIGPSEVAALLARLVADERLASSVRTERRWWFKKQILELELLAKRDAFKGYERRLIDRLFFSKRTRVDTKELRKRYRSSGFSPASTIAPGIGRRRKKLPGFSSRHKKPSPRRSLFLALAGVLCLGFETLLRGFGASLALAVLVFLAFIPAVVLGYSSAPRYAHRVEGLWLAAAGFLLPLAFTAAILLGSAWDAYPIVIGEFEFAGAFGWIGIILLFLALLNSVLNMARTRERAMAIAFRKRLAVVRRWFEGELESSKPQLDDGWLPYLLAFGLEKRVDGWFRDYGSASEEPSLDDFSHGPVRTGSSASFSGSGGSNWTGGGGTFGGAGATASWAAAATMMASGVARPGSSGSSSGGGSSGGGSSTGGGGGGGW